MREAVETRPWCVDGHGWGAPAAGDQVKLRKLPGSSATPSLTANYLLIFFLFCLIKPKINLFQPFDGWKAACVSVLPVSPSSGNQVSVHGHAR